MLWILCFGDQRTALDQETDPDVFYRIVLIFVICAAAATREYNCRGSHM